MAKRTIIKIDEKKCNGCGVCIPNCPEGALHIIDGKARLVSDIFCDGLGACIGHCPQGAISTEQRDAEGYDEKKVMRENIIKAGKNTIIAHLNHLKDHGENKYYNEALEVLREEGIDIDLANKSDFGYEHKPHVACPGSATMDFSSEQKIVKYEVGSRPSQLTHWPIQLHLISTNASFFRGKDVLLVADCVGYSVGDFHKDFLLGRSIIIACPKLDSDLDVYVKKLTSLIDESKINTLTVMVMKVPCCTGLLGLAKKAAENADRKIPIKKIVVGIKGDILEEVWI